MNSRRRIGKGRLVKIRLGNEGRMTLDDWVSMDFVANRAEQLSTTS